MIRSGRAYAVYGFSPSAIDVTVCAEKPMTRPKNESIRAGMMTRK